jgi:PiT family inorganic phosphate transporter
MLATLAGASIWVAIATIFKAPVSTTHSIIWWLIWAWVTAIWIDIVSWWKVWQIAASWLISPVMWWIIATILFLSIRKNILKQEDRWESAKIWLPVYIGLMIWAFVTYLLMKWFKPILKELDKNVSGYDLWPALLDPSISLFIWFIMSILVFSYFRLYYKSQNSFFKNSKKFINKLFNFPLIFAVALLSFAHWANDVANAIWPLAAINSVIHWWAIWWKAWIAMWVMLIWAIWLVLWLSVFGSRLIKTVWSEITKLNQVRAYCVALAAAITVILASGLWLPVSSTHIALGWIFWIWLTREVIKRLKWKHKIYIKKSMITRIALAWIITLPASWVIASITFLTIKALN